ncbi:hypothetical protein FSC12_08000 [Acinetobacter schindleri]|nr:hypothetical protein FSC12_08000 [Acinetobacter schindleri]
MLFSVFYVGDSCQGWGREFESRFPLQILKALIERLGLFLFSGYLAKLKLDAWLNIYFSGYFHNPLLQLIY